MRKRISCRVIRSVPLDRSDDSLRNVGKPSVHQRIIADAAALTYTGRLVVTRTGLDAAPSPRTLDLYV